jgi:flagellum-specific peptidoglycan hydrolase FlgJ
MVGIFSHLKNLIMSNIDRYQVRSVQKAYVKPIKNSFVSVFVVVGCVAAALFIKEGAKYNDTFEALEVEMLPAEVLKQQADTIAVAIAEAKELGENEFAVKSPPTVKKLRPPAERRTVPKKTTIERYFTGKSRTSFKHGYVTGEAIGFEGGDAQSYMDFLAPHAKRASKRTGIPTSVIMAQDMVESANGKSYLAKNHNNHFGLKCRTNCRKAGHCVQRTDDTRYDRFKSFPTIEKAFDEYVKVLNASRYDGARSSDPYTAILGLKKGGYATDRSYVTAVWNKLKKYNLTKYDK